MFNPVAAYEFVFTVCQPVVVAVGVGEPHGKIITCQEVATLVFGFAGCVQLYVIVVPVMEPVVTFKFDGLVQVGTGAQVILAAHPPVLTELSLLNLKVKQPLGLEAVKGPGKFAPVNVPQ